MLAPELTLHNLTAKELYLKIRDIIENYRYFDDVVEKLWRYAQETSWGNVAQNVELYQKHCLISIIRLSISKIIKSMLSLQLEPYFERNQVCHQM